MFTAMRFTSIPLILALRILNISNENSDIFVSITTREHFWKVYSKFINSFHKYLHMYSAPDAVVGIWDMAIKNTTITTNNNKREKSLSSWNLHYSSCLSLGSLRSRLWIRYLSANNLFRSRWTGRYGSG